MNGGGDNNGGQVVDRFWIITPSGFATTAPTSTLTFVSTSAEAAGIVGNLRAQRWGPGNNWENAISGQSNPTSTSALVPGVTGYSTVWTMASALTPLPITLVTFVARPSNGVVNLEWETASEFNNHFFEVERSRDGESFSVVARIDGAGTSTSHRKYRAIDTYPFSGLSYYRLRQQDFDGKFTYSNVVRVQTASSFTLLVHPNPSDGNEFSINWRDGTPGNRVGVRLWTQAGAKAFDGVVVLDENRESTISFPDRLAVGLYVVELATDEGVQRLKIVIR
jgi:hypothetical protein